MQLKLPVQWSIHLVFHTSLIRPYVETPSHGPNFTRPPPDLIDGEEEYEVEQIRSHRRWGCRKTLQYLIKWKGYPESDNTWEDANQIHAPILIKLYHRTNALEAIKVRHIQFEHQHPPLLLVKTYSSLITPSSTIIHPSTPALLWNGDQEETNRSACSPHLLPRAQCPSGLLPHTMQPESCAILTETQLILQNSTVTNNNSLFAPRHPALDPSPKCCPMACTTYQMSHQMDLLSSYLPDLLRHQPQSPSHPVLSR